LNTLNSKYKKGLFKSKEEGPFKFLLELSIGGNTTVESLLDSESRFLDFLLNIADIKNSFALRAGTTGAQILSAKSKEEKGSWIEDLQKCIHNQIE
jgi:hypothetical protein